MGSVKEDGVHVHDPCIECGEAEAMVDGLCEECTTTNPRDTRRDTPEPVTDREEGVPHGPA